MKNDTTTTYTGCAALAILLVWLAAWGAVLVTAVHFVRKYW